ncbi:ATP-grasp domain-containing protein [Lentzea sp. BCCO 10_0061]|uniref:ATP-grasp domain-containing protein n=1 Tax=Lentzea sokolovensis TaxID=3095429 RepID=A0ABU4UQW0_9PSEU|nr:ATP-grasp domain-containing protein [Lentzea sp. BCCO 10_0061]MDX8141880.1 ATP-grasp domain-containing protein [Lentzea sp. BCCO 10_0061]
MRTTIVALQSKQPLTVAPSVAFPPGEFDLVVLTDGAAGAVLREDVTGPAPEVTVLDREKWLEQIRGFEGPVEVVTNDEYCLAECARLREELGLAARHPRRPVAYLDKVVMKRLLAADGVRVPRFHAFEPVVTAEAAELLLEEIGLPAVAKPRQEANSRGITFLHTPQDLSDWLAEHDGEPGWQVDEFVDGTLHHVNALVRDGEITPVQVGRYLGPLVGVHSGRTLGGATEQESEFTEAAHEMNERVVRALGSEGSFVVHTEFAVNTDGEMVVLEVAGRAPGALVSELALLHAGVQLEVANLRMQAGLPVPEPVAQDLQAAWLWPAVMPGTRFHEPGPDLNGLASGHEVHVRRAAREGNETDGGLIGASVLLWHRDPARLAEDVVAVGDMAWFA